MTPTPVRKVGDASCNVGTAVRWFTRALVFAMLSFASPVLAGEHPVPLADNFDDAKCGECHGDKTKGKAVHSAMALGCSVCHEVKNEEQVTTVRLTAATPLALCLSCHTDKAVSEAKGRVHPPVAQDCLTCHSPHVSDNPNQLLKPTTGDKAANLCLQCHNKGVGVAEAGSRHAALDSGCDTCHVTHKTGERGQQEFDFHLAKAAPGLCLDCHDAGEPSLATAHAGQPFAKANCASCHDPHDSRAPKLAQKNLHPPFEAKMCETCHQPAQDGKVVLVENSQPALCFSCHDDIAARFKAKQPHSLFQVSESCTECHYPHASRYPKMLARPQAELCTGCHEPEQQAVTHRPYAQGLCATCHEPHGSDFDNHTRAAAPELCLGCHGSRNPAVQRDQQSSQVTLPWKVVLPAAEYDRAAKLTLDSGSRGHPIIGHPVAGKNTRAADPKEQQKNIGCLSCHQPHGSAARGLMPKGVSSTIALCGTCHG